MWIFVKSLDWDGFGHSQFSSCFVQFAMELGQVTHDLFFVSINPVSVFLCFETNIKKDGQ